MKLTGAISPKFLRISSLPPPSYVQGNDVHRSRPRRRGCTPMDHFRLSCHTSDSSPNRHLLRQYLSAVSLTLVICLWSSLPRHNIYRPRRDRYDYTQLSHFYSNIKTSLLSMTHNEFPSPNPTLPHIIAYTDGSCPNNRVVSFDNPAGWGFASHHFRGPRCASPTRPDLETVMGTCEN